uniref:NADH dehydrogenase subunit 6 n=1 Tax=Gnathophyllum americanum TaxID=390955 RepID=UPI0030038CAE
MITNLTIMIVLICSSLFLTLQHPLAMALLIILQTVLICVLTTITSHSPWFSYILFLIFLGAVLVVFSYIAALASNEKFKLSVKMYMLSLIGLLLSSPLIILLSPLNSNLKLSQIPPSFNKFLNLNTHHLPTTLEKMYNTSFTPTTMFIIIYLLITLVIVVNMAPTSAGPLRKS